MLAKLDREVAAWNAPTRRTRRSRRCTSSPRSRRGARARTACTATACTPTSSRRCTAGRAAGTRSLPRRADRQSTLEEELKALLPYLQRPDVHLGLDPEFAMTKGGLPGKRVGTYDASHINYASGVLADLVSQHRLPPKVLVVHRFTGPMLTNAMQIRRDPRVQIVIDMDGWGPPHGKRATWSRFIYPYPVQYTGFKLFYHNDTKAGHPLMKPRDVLALHPDPLYIQYQ
jgi:hypothetical protein